jgi:hypothetical protein
LIQDEQNTGPFGFAASSALIRGSQHLSDLSFACCHWGACVESDSWKDSGLPALSHGVIRRGTRSVFDYVKAVQQGGIWLCGEILSSDCVRVDLNNRTIYDDELASFFETMNKDIFCRLLELNLVILFFFLCGLNYLLILCRVKVELWTDTPS